MRTGPGVVVGCGIQPPHRLVDSNGPPERGWSSPLNWTGQSCANRRHRGSWGITGVEAQIDEAAPVSCWSGAPAGSHCVSSIRVLSPPDSAPGWQPLLPQPWMADLGAQPSAGIAQWIGPEGGAAPDTLTLEPTRAGAQVLHGVEWVPQHAQFVFHDLGANGANSTSWMRNPHFKTQLRAVSPDLVILAWGINDAHMAQSRFDAQPFFAAITGPSLTPSALPGPPRKSCWSPTTTAITGTATTPMPKRREAMLRTGGRARGGLLGPLWAPRRQGVHRLH